MALLDFTFCAFWTLPSYTRNHSDVHKLLRVPFGDATLPVQFTFH